MIISRRHKIRLSMLLMFTVLCHYGMDEGIFSDYVWCFGKNGHIAMEPAGHYHMARIAPIALDKQTTTLQTSTKHSDCIDVSVSNGDQACSPQKMIDSFKLHTDNVGLLFFLLFFCLPFLCSNNRIPLFRYPSFVDSGQLALRSTVLLN